MRAFAYGGQLDGLNEYFHIAESTLIKTMKKFRRGMVDIFGEEYVWRTNDDDIWRLRLEKLPYSATP